MNKVRLPAILGCLGCIAVLSCTPERSAPPRDASGSDVEVPASIARDCSRPVETEIVAFLETVPDGSRVLFPEGGCYSQHRTIVVADRHGLDIDGGGSTFRMDAPSGSAGNNANWRVAGGSRITLRNMLVRGAYDPLPRGTPGSGGSTDHGISLWGATETTVVDVEVSNPDGECVTADSDVRKGTDYRLNPISRNITIDRLRCLHAGRQGVAATAVEGFTLSNSFIDDAQQNGVDIEIDVPGQIARDITITDNTFGGIYFSAVAVPLGDSPDVGNVTIKSNRMVNAPDTCYPAIYIGDNRFRMRDIRITDNVLLTQGDGVRLIHVDSGEVARNTITKVNPENTACHNPDFNPAANVGIRLFDSSVRAEGNVLHGLPAG
ncbi:MAG TPA: right-handed parallel beta-helix repeat-containing protein [Egibacteraceae bacterium]|nr:right-handed parallel beta-helix repeat-containing protein [Egibacteraceae bacterium]